MNDFSMIGLFKMEAESQCAVLATGLLALEDNSGAAEKIEPLMRAAHSLKGAARIVQLDPVVKVAHAMEDCFVAAGEGKLVLAAEHIDKLLEGVDSFNQLSSCSESEIPAYLEKNSDKMAELEKAFADIKNGNFKSAPPVSITKTPEVAIPLQEPAKTPPVETVADKHGEKSSFDKEAVVRIAADKMNRLMGLAAESLVGVKRLQGFEKKILRHKKRLLEIAALIDQVEQTSADSGQSAEIKRILKDIQYKHNEYYRDYTEYFADFSDYSMTMDNFSDSLYREVVSCRMRPFIEGVRDFPRSVRDLSRKLGKKVSLEIIGESIAVDKDILDRLNAPLNHLVRNAVDHGIETTEERRNAGKNETGTIRLTARHWAGMLNITIADDGKGIDIEKIRAKAVSKGLTPEEIANKLSEAELLEFMFLPGFSTATAVTEISGRGVGLDVVQTMAQEVRGMVKVETSLGKGSSFNLQVPVSLSVMPSLVTNIGGESYAFPLMRIDHLLTLPKEEIMILESRQYVKYEGKNIGLVSAAQVLELDVATVGSTGTIHVVIISDRLNQYAIFVESFIGEFELVVRPLDSRLGKVSDISSVSVLEDGSPVLILDIDDMVRSIDNLLNGGRLHDIGDSKADSCVAVRKRILVVDDSITVREVERNLLTNNGYDVDVAVDGAEGWNAVRTGQYALVVTDVDMPRMNGIELVANIKKHERLHSLPVMIVSYKDREEDRLRGLEAGADYYLTKSSFHDNTLMDAVESLIGKAGE
jgi:two-component system sensor histidine kinase and response regulator WspE